MFAEASSFTVLLDLFLKSFCKGLETDAENCSDLSKLNLGTTFLTLLEALFKDVKTVSTFASSTLFLESPLPRI